MTVYLLQALRAYPSRIAALLLLSARLLIYRENCDKKPSLGKNPRKCYSFSYNSKIH
jgi:hypothetical protein